MYIHKRKIFVEYIQKDVKTRNEVVGGCKKGGDRKTVGVGEEWGSDGP